MKNTCNIKNIIKLIICFVAGVFFIACGLDVIISVEAPGESLNTVTYEDTDYANWYCSFTTNETKNQNLDGGAFLGTDVYYKIYNSPSQLCSERNNINSINTSTYTTEASTRMIDTYKFKPLKVGFINDSKIIKRNYEYFVPLMNDTENSSIYTNVKIKFRPKAYKYGSGINFNAYVMIENDSNDQCYLASLDGLSFTYVIYDESSETWTDKNGSVVDYNSIIFAEPIRNLNSSRTFDFFDERELKEAFNSEPDSDSESTSNDGDFGYSTNSDVESGKYYVQFYAVSVAQSELTLANSYSLVVDLGSIPIIKE